MKFFAVFSLALLFTVAAVWLSATALNSGAVTSPPAAAATPEPSEKETLTYNEYSLSLEYFPDERLISGFERVRYKNNTVGSINKICFNLYFNAFSKENTFKPYFQSSYGTIYINGEEDGGVNIISTFVNGSAGRYSVNGTILTVYLPFVLQKNQEVSIDIRFHATIPTISARTGSDEKSVWLGNFIPVLAVYDRTNQQWRQDPYYPAGKPFFSGIANYTVKVQTPINYTVIGAGDMAVSTVGDKKTTTITAVRVREFAFAISDSYKTNIIQTDSGVYVHMSSYSDVDTQTLETLSNVVKNSLDYFSAYIGSYPYSSLKIIENGNYINTTAYPQIIFISTACLTTDNQAAAVMSLVTSVARQWFYSVVGNDQIREAWLSDGLSYYLAYSYIFRDSPDRLQETMNDLYQGLAAEYNDLTATSLSDDISVYTSSHAYTSIQITKAMLMFHALSEYMGRQAFNDFIKLYYKQNYLTIASGENLIKAAEESSGMELRGFITEWVSGPELPEWR